MATFRTTSMALSAAAFLALPSALAAATPTLCEMAAAFDRAMKERYRLANYVAADGDCRFIDAQGCRFGSSVNPDRSLVIKISHLGAPDCVGEARCTFSAVQVCAEGGAVCRELMFTPEISYRVDAAVEPREGGGWRLTDWSRTPDRDSGGALSRLEDVCLPL